MRIVRGLLLLVGCGLWSTACYRSHAPGGAGESGLDRDDELSTLAQAEIAQLCDWGVEIGAVTGAETDCTIEVVVSPTLQECQLGLQEASAQSSCAFTVAELETCWRAMAADPCTGYHAAVCAPPAGCE